MQTEGGGWFISRKLSLRTGTCGIHNITENQKVRNYSPSFPHICIQLRAPGTDSVGQLGIQGAVWLVRRLKKKSILGAVWEWEVGSVVPSLHSGMENAMTLGSICSSDLQAPPKPFYPQGVLKGSGQWLQGWRRSLYLSQNRAWNLWDFSRQIWIPSWKTKKDFGNWNCSGFRSASRIFF